MNKTIYSKLAKQVQEVLVQMRKDAGMTQRDLAKKMGREHSFVARIEQGERRVDVVEFYLICKACEAVPEKEVQKLCRKMSKDF